MSEVMENIKTRRSVRAYKDTPVSKETLDQIITAGLYAPSAGNNQKWQLTVVQDSGKLEELRGAIAKALGDKAYKRFYGAPVLIILSAPADYPHGAVDCACVLENMFLAAKDLGLGSVWINQLNDTCDAKPVRKLLGSFGVPSNHVIHGSAAIGYPSGEVKTDRENTGKVVYA